MTSTYQMPLGRVEAELVVNKSRFIAWIAPAADREQAMALLDEARKCYPDARHHCWAYVLGNPANAASAAANDDGEPSGTAGKPILNVIQHKGIGDVMVVVIRYFGGIKLGAGGLVRAYSAVTRQATQRLELVEQRPSVWLCLHTSYSREPLLQRWLDEHDTVPEQVSYAAEITLRLRLEKAHLPLLEAFVAAVDYTRIEYPDRASD